MSALRSLLTLALARLVTSVDVSASTRVASETRVRADRLQPTKVYHWCMSRTNIEIDDVACRAVMNRYQLRSKREAVNMALRLLASEPLDVDDARKLRGSGWDGDLDEMRSSRVR